MTMGWDIFRVETAFVTHIAAPIHLCISVENLVPTARLRHPDAVTCSWHGCHVAYDQDNGPAAARSPQHGKDGIRRIIHHSPLEAAGITVSSVERRLGRVDAVEITHEPLNA
jgi:hypothetical protein